MSRPPLSALLADPAGLVLRTDLLAAGWPERLVDALFQRCARREPGYSRPFVLAGDVPTSGAEHDRRALLSDAIATIPRGVPGSAYIVARGEGPQRRFLVRYKLGGREAKIEHAGSFKRKSDAVLRRNFVTSLIAAGKGADVRTRLRSSDAANGAITVRTAAERWQASRVDVAEGTAQTYRVALARILPRIGHKTLEEIDVAVVTDLVAELSGLKRESIRKTLSVLAQVLDHARIQPNPVRDPLVKLPRGERKEVNPPTAEHVKAVHRLLPTRYKLPC